MWCSNNSVLDTMDPFQLLTIVASHPLPNSRILYMLLTSCGIHFTAMLITHTLLGFTISPKARTHLHLKWVTGEKNAKKLHDNLYGVFSAINSFSILQIGLCRRPSAPNLEPHVRPFPPKTYI